MSGSTSTCKHLTFAVQTKLSGFQTPCAEWLVFWDTWALCVSRTSGVMCSYQYLGSRNQGRSMSGIYTQYVCFESKFGDWHQWTKVSYVVIPLFSGKWMLYMHLPEKVISIAW